MSKKTTQLLFFISLTLGLLALSFFIFRPYFGVIFVAGVFAVSFYPLYTKLVVKFNGRQNWAALATTFLILIFIIIPLVVLSALLLKETIDLYNTVALGTDPQSLIGQAGILLNKINTFFPSEVLDSSIDLESYTRNALNWVMEHFGSISSAIFGGILNFFLMLVALFYFLIFGEKIKKDLIFWSPLPDEYDEVFVQTLKSAIDAILRGRILVAIAQGVFIGIGFVIFGIGSPVLWGFVGGIASLLPMLGTSIITVPAVAFLFLSGQIGAGIGLLIWATLAIGLIDNVVSVIFLKDKIKIHPLIVLFSILGGVEFFGVIGFLIGPIIVSALIALIKIYPLIKNDQS